MPNIRYVAGVSWPRSGHHLVQRLLQGYFGPHLSYDMFYHPELDCCRVFPCTRGRVHFSKNHDWDLSGVMSAGLPYLIQYRSAAAAAVSDFELTCAKAIRTPQANGRLSPSSAHGGGENSSASGLTVATGWNV